MTMQVNLLTGRTRITASARRVWGELRTNRRAMIGACVIAVLLAVQGVLRLDAAVDAARAAYITQALHLRRIAAGASGPDWAARAKSSGARLASLEHRLWKAESEGVARANLQDFVMRLGRAARLDKLRVQIETTKPKNLAGNLLVRQVTATITAVQSGSALVNFLDRIEHDRHLIVVDQIQVETRPLKLLRMKLSTYAVLKREPAGQESTGR